MALVGLVLALTGAATLMPTGAAAQTPAGPFPCGPSNVLTCTITNVTTQGNQLLLSGTVANATGTVVTFTNVRLRDITGTVVGTTCQILHLELGPIDLDLLGLQVNTNQIVVDITAVAGSGNLLGNLLCAVANLLNPNQSADLLAAILRNLLLGL